MHNSFLFCVNGNNNYNSSSAIVQFSFTFVFNEDGDYVVEVFLQDYC